MSNLSLSEFSLQLCLEASRLIPSHTYCFKRPFTRLLTSTIVKAHELGVEPRLDSDGLDAVKALMQTVPIVKALRVEADYCAVTVGSWNDVLVEILRCSALSLEIAADLGRYSITRSFNYPMQAVASDAISTKKMLANAISGNEKLCLACLLLDGSHSHSTDCGFKEIPSPTWEDMR